MQKCRRLYTFLPLTLVLPSSGGTFFHSLSILLTFISFCYKYIYTSSSYIVLCLVTRVWFLRESPSLFKPLSILCSLVSFCHLYFHFRFLFTVRSIFGHVSFRVRDVFLLKTFIFFFFIQYRAPIWVKELGESNFDLYIKINKINGICTREIHQVKILFKAISKNSISLKFLKGSSLYGMN